MDVPWIVFGTAIACEIGEAGGDGGVGTFLTEAGSDLTFDLVALETGVLTSSASGVKS